MRTKCKILTWSTRACRIELLIHLMPLSFSSSYSTQAILVPTTGALLVLFLLPTMIFTLILQISAENHFFRGDFSDIIPLPIALPDSFLLALWSLYHLPWFTTTCLLTSLCEMPSCPLDQWFSRFLVSAPFYTFTNDQWPQRAFVCLSNIC